MREPTFKEHYEKNIGSISLEDKQIDLDNLRRLLYDPRLTKEGRQDIKDAIRIINLSLKGEG